MPVLGEPVSKGFQIEEDELGDSYARLAREREILDSFEFSIRGPAERTPKQEEPAESDLAQIGVFGERIALKTLVGQTNF